MIRCTIATQEKSALVGAFLLGRNVRQATGALSAKLARCISLS
jgi:hypothetical protein